MAFCRFISVCLIAALCLLPAITVLGQSQVDGELVSSANQGHLWFALPSAQIGASKAPAATKPSDDNARGYDLYHHASDLGGPYYKVQNWLARRPLSITSWNNRVWVVFPPKLNAPEPRLEVFTIEVEKSSALDVYMSVPSGRLDIVEPLPGHRTLASFVGTAEGPVALLLADADEAQPQLLRLQNGRWTPIELPSDFKGIRGSRLAASGQNGSQFTLLAPHTSKPGVCFRYDRQPGGGWDASEVGIDAHQIRALVSVDGQVAVALEKTDRTLDVLYLRPAGLAVLTTLVRPAGDWSLVGFDGSLQMISRAVNGTIEIQKIELLSGDVLKPHQLVNQPLTTGKLWQLSMLVAISVSGLLLVFLIKPVSKAPVTLPAGTAPLPASMRIGALLLDLLPAGVIVGFVLRKQFDELLKVPVLTIDLEQSIPFLMMAGLTVLHCTITELAKGVSLGKALIGARVISVTGDRPRPYQILVRNLLKCLILVVPPLAVFALINPHVQGLSDIAAGTVVVHEPGETNEEPHEDR